MDAVEEAIKKHKVYLVIVASDISQRTMENISCVCTNNKIKIIQLNETMENLGKAIGKINRAIFGIKDKNFAEGILKKISGGNLLWEK